MKKAGIFAGLIGFASALEYTPRTLRNSPLLEPSLSTTGTGVQFEQRWFENQIDHFNDSDSRVSDPF